MSQTESQPDLALAAEFEPASREAWLALVRKVLKGADFDKRLVSRTRDGLTIQPLYTRADAVDRAVAGAVAVGRSGGRNGTAISVRPGVFITPIRWAARSKCGLAASAC